MAPSSGSYSYLFRPPFGISTMATSASTPGNLPPPADAREQLSHAQRPARATGEGGGRQLGRLADAVEQLVQRLVGGVAGGPAELRTRAGRIHHRHAQAHVE